MAKLNQLLCRPWFDLKIKLIAATNLALLASAAIHVNHFCDTRAKILPTEKVITMPCIITLSLVAVVAQS